MANSIEGYSLVMITRDGGTISRDQGSITVDEAIKRAKEMRNDFPHADEIRVIQHGAGVIHTF